MPTTLTNGIQLPDKGSVDWYNSMQSNYNLIDTHLGDTDTHVTAEDRANWNSKQGSLSQAQLDAIAQVATNTDDIATLQSGKADASHTHSSSDITDIGDYATKDYVDNSISGLVDNAPAALDTLKELSTALNDDANFASTVTTALAAKADSADLATVATSGSYTDLDDKPTINDSTITIQKNGSTVDTFTTNGSAKTIDIPVPTKTSDLTNDSNFVDTSNSAVASGITSAKVTDYDTHIADTDIHVTTADKATWNTVTSKANDSDVVHKSGNETVGGVKTFTGTNEILRSSGDHKLKITDTRVTPLDPTGSITSNITWQDSTGRLLGTVANVYDNSRNSIMQLYARSFNANDEYESHRLRIISNKGGNSYADVDVNFLPSADNRISLGSSTFRWNGVYATNYYYGSNNVEFSTKFVTTDTNQTISGNKTFSSNVNVYNSDSTTDTANIVLKNSKAEVGTEFAEQSINFVDKNNNPLAKISCYGSSGNYTRLYITASDSNNNSEGIFIRKSTTGIAILPTISSTVWIGTSASPFYNVHTKKINALEPSSLSLPSGNLNDIIDISSYLTYLDGSIANTYIAPANGWISITMGNCSGIQAYINGLWGHQIVRPTTGDIRFLMPILKDKTANILIYSGTINNARFIPCQGNV